jgi:hypothetical protein
MNARERALRKQLLLVKGDALRMQLGMELGIVRQRVTHARSLFGVLGFGSQLLAMFAAGRGEKRGWRRLPTLLLRLLGIWKSARKVWETG